MGWRWAHSAVLVIVLMLAGAGSAVAQGDAQQSFLAKLISRALSSPEGTVRIGAVEGALSSDATIRDIEISDRQGPWLRLDRARLVWRRTALLQRRLEVDTLEIGRIEVLRRPVRPEANHAGASSDEPLLPELPVAVIISALSVGELVLGEAVAGVPARLGITGRASLGAPADGLHAALSVQRLDRDGTSELRLAFVPKGETLDLALKHRESAGGLVAHFLEIEGRPAVDFDLSGTGTLDNWQARLAFAAGQVAQAAGRVTILRQGAARRLDLDIDGTIDGLLPPLAATIFAGRTRLTGAMTVEDDGALALSGLRLGSQQAELTVSGTVSKDRLLDVRAQARSLGGGVSGARAGALKTLNLDVRAAGPWAAPAVQGRLDAEILRLAAFADDLGLPIRGALKLEAEVAGTPSDRVLDASFTAQASGLGIGQPQLAALLGPQATLSGKASLRGTEIMAEAVTLKGQRIEAVLDGQASQKAGGLAGVLRLGGKLDGRPMKASTRFASLADGAIDLTELDMQLGRSAVRGALRLAGGGAMTGAVSAKLSDLSDFSVLAGTSLRGALTAEAKFSAPQGAQRATFHAKGQNISGFGAVVAALDAEAQLAGALARPTGTFRASLTGVQHADARRAGLSRLNITSTGTFAGDHAVLEASLGGGPQLALKIKGAAPFSSTGKLDLAVTGKVDAGLANSRLTGGQRVTGRVVIDGGVRGSYARPAVEGTAILSNGSFVDLLQGTRLTGISGRVQGAGQSLRIEQMTGVTPGGGTIAVSGTIDADPARGFPANLRLTGENAQLIDNGVVDVVAGLDLAVSGPLASAPQISGVVRIVSFDVAIPDRLPADAAPIANARHLSPPEQTRARLKVLAQEKARSKARRAQAGGGPQLSVKVSAPSHIFVRGRGIDAELGGELVLSGPISAPRTNGAFELRRGQISMLTQRLEFSRGRLAFFGDLMPELDFVAATSAGGVTAKVAVTGRADAPVFTLSSEPQLPPDEVLSRLMFERAVGRLSPLQAVQLAQAVARLSGRGGPDVVDKVRQALGVDTLDVSVGKDGPTVGASRYITRGVRLGVKAGATPEQSGVTVNIDLGRRIKLQGETSSSGKASVGIGAEIEY